MAYIPWWQRMSPPTFAERFELGGVAGRVGLEKGTHWSDFLNPGEFLKRQPSEEEKIEFKQDLSKGVEFAKEKWKDLWPELVKDFTPVQGEIRAKKVFDENLAEIAQAKKEKKYIEMTGHALEGSVLGAATLPWWTGVGTAGKIASKFLRLGKFITARSNKASKVKIHEKAKYLDDDWMSAINEFTLTKHGGNFKKAMSDLGLSEEQVKGIFHRRGKKLAATGHRLKTQLPSGTRTFSEVTTDMKYKPEILMNRYNKLIEEGTIAPKKYYNSKELANLFDINPSRYHMKEFVTRLKEEGIKSRNLTTGPHAIKEYEVGDAVNKMLARMKIKKIAGDPKSTSVRSKLEMEFDPDLTKVLNNIRARTAELAEETGVYIKSKDIDYFGVGQDAGHAFSLQVMDRYPLLFKNSNLRSIQTMMYQDPVINKSILVGEKFQGRQEKIFKELDQYVNKKVSKDNIKQINNLGTDLKNIHKEIIESINRKATDNSYFIGQAKRIPELKLKKFNVGDTVKSEDIFADMSTVDKRFQVGEISKINSKAKKFKDLSKKEQKLYETNVINQHVENLEKFYEHSFSADEIQELKDAFEYGSFESRKKPVYKAEGGLSGVDQYILNRYK